MNSYEPDYGNPKALKVSDLIAILQNMDPDCQIRLGLEDGDDILTLRGVTNEDVGGEHDPFGICLLVPECAFPPPGSEWTPEWKPKHG